MLKTIPRGDGGGLEDFFKPLIVRNDTFSSFRQPESAIVVDIPATLFRHAVEYNFVHTLVDDVLRFSARCLCLGSSSRRLSLSASAARARQIAC